MDWSLGVLTVVIVSLTVSDLLGFLYTTDVHDAVGRTRLVFFLEFSFDSVRFI